jgi:hypothetical protein
MKHVPGSKPISFGTRPLAALLFANMFAIMFAIFFAIIAVPLDAYAASETHPAQGFGPVYDAAHETTLDGTIQQVVTRHTVGSPAGMHLMVAGPQGLVDAHVGPFLSKEMKTAVQAGMPVRIVGATTLLHGKSYFLARQVTIGDHTVTVRSPRGILMPPHSDVAPHSRTRKPVQTENNGGAR